MRRVLQAALAALAGASALVFLLPGVALATSGFYRDTHPLGTVNTILIFVVGPLVVFLIIAALTLRPRRSTGASRYRPGQPWPYPAQWFGPQGSPPPRPLAELGEVDATQIGGASGSW